MPCRSTRAVWTASAISVPGPRTPPGWAAASCRHASSHRSSWSTATAQAPRPAANLRRASVFSELNHPGIPGVTVVDPPMWSWPYSGGRSSRPTPEALTTEASEVANSASAGGSSVADPSGRSAPCMMTGGTGGRLRAPACGIDTQRHPVRGGGDRAWPQLAGQGLERAGVGGPEPPRQVRRDGDLPGRWPRGTQRVTTGPARHGGRIPAAASPAAYVGTRQAT